MFSPGEQSGTLWSEPRIRQLQVLKDIAYKIIDFIAQFEDELVKIWNKPKFVLNSNYVITLDRIAGRDLTLLERLLAHPSFPQQVREWRELGMVGQAFKSQDVWQADLFGQRLDDRYQYLPLDTRYFKDLEPEILALFDHLDRELDGWLIKSENYQALNTLLPKFRERVKCIYIDPPYNTGSDEFIYNDRYRHSAWLTLIEERACLSQEFLTQDGTVCVSIDDIELPLLLSLLRGSFGEEQQLATLVWDRNRKNDATFFSVGHEYMLVFAKDRAFLRNKGVQFRELKPGIEEARTRFNWLRRKCKDNWDLVREEWNAYVQALKDYEMRGVLAKYPKVGARGPYRDDGNINWPGPGGPRYTVLHPNTKKPAKIPQSGWRYSTPKRFWEEYEKGRIAFGSDETTVPGVIYYLFESTEQVMGSVFWSYAQTALGEFNELFGARIFENPKNWRDIRRVCNYLTTKQDLLCDFFAGSGTTAHAVINLNRQDGGKRKYILVEMADYFETVLLPRVKKVVFSDKWKDGQAQNGQGLSHFVKYYQLEQYEDVLRRARYQEAEPLFIQADPYSQYVFLRDTKLLDNAQTGEPVLTVDSEKEEARVDLSKLYDGVDLAETLSCLTGKWIRRITADTMEFEDGEQVNLANPPWELVKPLIWW